MENIDEIEEWISLLPSELSILEKISIVDQIEKNVNENTSFISELNKQLEHLSEVSEHSISFDINSEGMLEHRLKIIGTVFEIIDDKLGKDPA